MNVRRIARPLAVAAAALVTAMAAQAAPVADVRVGSLVPVTAAKRVVSLTPETQYVNVRHGETVRFQLPDGQSFAVDFNGTGNSFDLNQIAPSGLLPQRVVAYVEQDGDQ